jgi:hypothetical protein
MRKPPAPALSQVYDLLFPENGQGNYIVAAIIDPSLWFGLDELLRYHSPEWYILFDKKPTAELVQALPRIVRLEPNAVFTGMVLREYGNRRNIYLRADIKNNRPDLCDLSMNLKAFANVKVPGNEWSWLRYYDPVIFCHLMQVATYPQKKYLFGSHISSFFAESTWDGKVMEFKAQENDYQPEKPLVFTPEQKEAFDELHFARFKLELTDYILGAYFSKITADRQVAALSEEIHNALDLSMQHGAVQKSQSLEFVTLGAQHGFDCYSSEPVSKILASTGKIDEKIDRIKAFFAGRPAQPVSRRQTDAI